MGKLTFRERILILILIYLALLAGGLYFLILPALESYNQLSGQVLSEEQNERLMRAAIQGADAAKTAAEKQSGELKSLSEHYYNSMTTTEIDRLITRMLGDHHLTPQTLKVSAPVQETLKAQTGATASGSKDSAVTAGILVSSVRVEAAGLRSDFVALADAVKNNPSLLITGFTVDANNKSTGSGAISIDFEVLMYDKVKE